MVSLTDRINYSNTNMDKPRITCFNNFVKGEVVNYVFPVDSSDTDKVYFSLIQSISNNNKDEFLKVYEEFSRRRPATENAWIHNEFLIFVLICGIEKYQLDKTWINEVILVRSTGNQQYLAINQTFRNILSDNTQSTDNINEIVIVFQELMNHPQLSKNILDKTYIKLSNSPSLIDSKDDFLITISIRAFDIILLTKDTPDATEITRLKEFKVIFQKRIKICREIIYYGLLIGFVILNLKYIHQYQSFRDYITDLSTVFQVGGLAFLALFRWIKKQLEILLLKLFGFYKVFHKNKT